MYDNILINGIHATRYIASWIREGGNLQTGRDLDEFSEWLNSIGISSDEISQIKRLASVGKMELEMKARHYLSSTTVEIES